MSDYTEFRLIMVMGGFMTSNKDWETKITVNIITYVGRKSHLRLSEKEERSNRLQQKCLAEFLIV